MYTHEAVVSDSFIGIRHYRERRDSSGLYVSEEMARSSAMVTVPDEPRHLLIATAEQTKLVEQTRDAGRVSLSPVNFQVDCNEIASSIGEGTVTRCSDLSDFVAKGIGVWKKILSQNTGIVKVHVALAEIHSTTEPGTDPGLVIAGHNPNDFLRFETKPNEIEALERIVKDITHLIEAGQPHYGVYA